MKIIYIPEDAYLIVNNITKTLLRRYENDNNIYLHIPSYFEMINIIIRLEKDEIQISSLFNYDLSKFTIVETQDNYYISMGLYTACVIAYRSRPKNDFSEALYDTIKDVFPNVLDHMNLVNGVYDKLKTSVRTINYSHRYLDILDDVYTLNNSYMNILKNSTDLDREDLNKLFRISVKYLIPIKNLIKVQSLMHINVFNNDYNFYKDRFYDFSILGNIDTSKPDIIQYLSCISKNDKYTNNNVVIEFKTSIADINKFTQKTVSSYKEYIPHITDILPISTMVDMFISISLDDIVRCSNVNEEISHLKDLLLFRNNYMNFAFHGNHEEDN